MRKKTATSNKDLQNQNSAVENAAKPVKKTRTTPAKATEVKASAPQAPAAMTLVPSSKKAPIAPIAPPKMA